MSGPKVSSKMKKGIKMIEKLLGVKYKGKTFDDAKTFLDENMPKIDGMDIRETMEPSEKMWKGIRFIEDFCGVTYNGHNMKDASEFIGQYLEQAKKAAERSRNGKH